MTDLKVFVSEFGSDAQIQSIALRYKVLRRPLGLEFSPDELNAESDQVHILAGIGQTVVGVLLLTKTDDKTLKMRQVAVLPNMQGSGVGKQLVLFSESHAKEKSIEKIELHARDSAVEFYLKLGYTITGNPFTEVGIPHFKMVKNLNIY